MNKKGLAVLGTIIVLELFRQYYENKRRDEIERILIAKRYSEYEETKDTRETLTHKELKRQLLGEG